MTLILKDGYYNEEHVKNGLSLKERKKMPASAAKFETYTINIDISSFNDDDKLDKEDIKEHHGMLSSKQLDSISKEKKIEYDNYLQERSRNFYITTRGNELYKYNDTILQKQNLKSEILDNFNLNNKRTIVDQSIDALKRTLDRNKNNEKRFKDKRKILNLYDHEFNYRFSFALACLVLFFIGAPLGSIIRKGGFGLPMIMAITIFVIYFFISQLGKNLAEESAISATIGSWLSTLILLPFGILLTRRAAKGMGIFNLDNIIDKLKLFFEKISKLKLRNELNQN